MGSLTIDSEPACQLLFHIAGCTLIDRRSVLAGYARPLLRLDDLCGACPGLRRLSILLGNEHKIRSLAPLAQLPELTDLVLHVKFEEAAFEAIGLGCGHLTRLDISACSSYAAQLPACLVPAVYLLLLCVYTPLHADGTCLVPAGTTAYNFAICSTCAVSHTPLITQSTI